MAAYYQWKKSTIVKKEQQRSSGTSANKVGGAVYKSTSNLFNSGGYYDLNGATLVLDYATGGSDKSKQATLTPSDGNLYLASTTSSKSAGIRHKILSNTKISYGGPGNIYLNGSWITYGVGDAPGSFVDYVYSTSSSAYPVDDSSGGYYYTRMGIIQSPTNPSGLTYPETIKTTSVDVSWSASSSVTEWEVAEYELSYSVNGGSSWKIAGITEDTNLSVSIPTGTESIKFRIRAKDTNNQWSDYVTGIEAEVILSPTMTVPTRVMEGESVPITWTVIDGAESYTLQRKVDSGEWETIYTGALTSYTDTAPKCTSLQYQVSATIDGEPGEYGQSDVLEVISASILVISGQDEDLGTITNDITYTVNTDTGNPITVKRYINENLVEQMFTESGFARRIPVVDLPSGTGTVRLEANVESSIGPTNKTRTWTYTKSPVDVPGSGAASVLLQDGVNTFPATLAELVRVPAEYGGTLDKVLARIDGILLPVTGVSLTVNAPAGSSITVTNGSTTLSGTATDGTWSGTLNAMGEWTITASLDGQTTTKTLEVSEAKAYEVSISYGKIFGVLWDGTSTTALSRTDDAADFIDPNPSVGGSGGSSPFDDLMPWAGMKRISDPEAGELVAIPKYWYKWTKSGNSLKLQIADKAVDGFFVSPAHCDRGDGQGERDVVYVGRYHCGINYKSTTGVLPRNNTTRETMRSSIHSLGDTIYQWDWAMNWTIKMLYLVEFADWNSQAKIGYGCGNDRSVQNVGYTDSMPYHTGTMQDSRTTYGLGVQYRYIEGLWDNVYDWVDGCYYNSNGLNIILNQNNFSDSIGGTLVGKPIEGYPSVMTVNESLNNQWIYPTTSTGSESTYIPDFWYFNASYPCLRIGGYFSNSMAHGLFLVFYGKASDADTVIGSRLMKLPNNGGV